MVLAAMPPGCFACHVDCATGCTDDQPYEHPYTLTTRFEDDDQDEPVVDGDVETEDHPHDSDDDRKVESAPEPVSAVLEKRR